MPSDCFRRHSRGVMLDRNQAYPWGTLQAQRSGIGVEAGTGTAVTLFCGLPSISLSL